MILHYYFTNGLFPTALLASRRPVGVTITMDKEAITKLMGDAMADETAWPGILQFGIEFGSSEKWLCRDDPHGVTTTI